MKYGDGKRLILERAALGPFTTRDLQMDRSLHWLAARCDSLVKKGFLVKTHKGKRGRASPVPATYELKSPIDATKRIDQLAKEEGWK